MNGAHRIGFSLRADMAVAGVSVAVLGCGALLALEGTLSSQVGMSIVGGVLAAAALVLLIAGGWLDGLTLVALAVPLPALFGSETLRIAAVLPFAAAVVTGWVLTRAAAHEPIRWARLPRRSLAALLGVFVVASVAGISPLQSARELANFGLLLAFLVVATDTFERNPAVISRVAGTLVIAAAVCGGLALLETLGILPSAFPRDGTAFNRAALGFGQPNGLGLFFALVLPLATHGLAIGRRRANALAVFAISVGLLCTFSRGAWLGVLVGMAPLWFTGDRRFVLRAWVVAIVFAVGFDLVSGGALRDTATRSVGDWSIEQRFALMATGVLMFLAHPVLGVGPGGFAQNIDQYGLQIPQLVDIQRTPHNGYVQMAAETGAVGLIAFVVFLWMVLRVLMNGARAASPTGTDEERGFRRAVLWSFGVLCFSALFDWPFPHGTGEVAMLVIAMGCTTSWSGAR